MCVCVCVCRYRGFELRYKNDIQILAMDYVQAMAAVLGQPRHEGKTANEVFRCR